MEIRWTRKALENLDAIAAYIAHDNPQRAGTFVKEIKAKTDLLAQFPKIFGKPILLFAENCGEVFAQRV
jgi:plasmid stabilization system protein ParE